MKTVIPKTAIEVRSQKGGLKIKAWLLNTGCKPSHKKKKPDNYCDN